MSKRTWSEPQKAAIESRGQSVLVSAGAGSGKTTVLIERIMRLILDEPRLDVHRLLIVTFTEAAASEMRQRLAEQLRARIEAADAEGGTELAHLSRQLSFLNIAQISTLHSFCMAVIRRNFMALGLDPGFRMIGEDEASILRQSLVEHLLEERLDADENEPFGQMLDAFGVINPVDVIPLVFRLDGFSRSQPDAGDWLAQVVARFEDSTHRPFAELVFADWFYRWIARSLEEAAALFAEACQLAAQAEELSSYHSNLTRLSEHTEAGLRLATNRVHLEEILVAIRAIESEKSPRAKQPHPLKDEVLALRREGLDKLKRLIEILNRGDHELMADIAELTPQVSQLVQFVLDFQAAYAKEKLTRGVLDFSDLEHFALRALQNPAIGEAERLREQFVEIFVDEYQDTSPIQDAIVRAIERPHGNVFVVGDVKQSIYRFRMAEPSIFLDKYFSMQEGSSVQTEGAGKVISLASNYRSRADVVNAVNSLFSQLFCLPFGGIVYDDAARMLAGAHYPESSDASVLAGPVEVHLIERRDQSAVQEGQELMGAAEGVESDGLTAEGEPGREGESGGLGDSAADDPDEGVSHEAFAASVPDAEASLADMKAIEMETLVIAERIRTWMGLTDANEHRKIWDKDDGCYRPLRFRDIVILLRSVKGRMNSVLEGLRNSGIPAYGATSSGFFDALEVQWLMAALSTINLPRSELALVTLLRSPLFGFSDDDLARIRLQSPGNFYDAFRKAARRPRPSVATVRVADERADADPSVDERADEVDVTVLVSESLRALAQGFLTTLQAWRTLARRSTTADVVRTVIRDTGILDFVLGMPGGEIRKANVQLLLDRAAEYDTLATDGVFGFEAWLADVTALNLDAGEARTLGEQEDVVRVMTIHQSKGLEFPVVFVADLGKQFYESPTERALPLHRDLGFGPERVDLVTDQRWKTMASLAVQEANQTEFRAEEARVLYVALTRARDQLVLVGSARGLDKLIRHSRRLASADSLTLPVPALLGARTYLEWLVPVWLRHQDGAALRSRLEDSDVRVIGDDPSRLAFDLWNVEGGQPLPAGSDRNSLGSDRRSLRSHRNPLDDVGMIGNVLALTEPVESQAAAPISELNGNTFGQQIPSKVSATDLRRLWVAKLGTGHRIVRPGTAERLLRVPVWTSPATARMGADGVIDHAGTTETEVVGKDLGTAFHEVMQKIDLDAVRRGISPIELLNTMVQTGALSSELAMQVAGEDVEAFFASELGQRVLRANRVFREQPFFCRIPTSASLGTGAFVVAQGVIDVLAEEERGWLIVDYKTDRVNQSGVMDKAQEYRAQVATYMRAVSDLVGNLPVEGVLYFVQSKRAVSMEPLNLEALWQG